MKKFAFLVVLFFMTGNLFSQLIYEEIINKGIRKVCYTNDNGTLMLHYSNANLYKMDSIGNLQWAINYSVNAIYDFIKCNNSGYVIAGTVDFNVSIPPRPFIAKIDDLGNMIWSNGFNDSTSNFGTQGYNKVVESIDGGFVLLSAYNFSISNRKLVMMKVDSTGNFLWIKTFGTNTGSWSIGAMAATPNGYLIAGYNNVNNFIFKLDLNGNFLWSKNIPGGNFVSQITNLSDNNFLFDFSTINGINCIMKCDSMGNKIWTIDTPAPSNWGSGNLETLDHKYLFSGAVDTFTSFDLIVKTDTNGAILNAYSYNLNNIKSISQLPNGDFSIINSTNPFNPIFQVIRSDSAFVNSCNAVSIPPWPTNYLGLNNTLGQNLLDTFPGLQIFSPSVNFVQDSANITVICNTTGFNNQILTDNYSISPNPFTTTLTLIGTTQKGELIIFDITGKEILRTKTFSEETKINTAHLTPGFYFVNYREENRRVNKKVVKM